MFRGRRRDRTLTSSASSVSTLAIAGVFLASLSSHGFLGGNGSWRWRGGSTTAGTRNPSRRSTGMAVALALSSTSVVAAEVQANGDILAAEAPGIVEVGGGLDVAKGNVEDIGENGKSKRVSSDVSVRFPVTTVEEQPERMIVIGDVHGDLGESLPYSMRSRSTL